MSEHVPEILRGGFINKAEKFVSKKEGYVTRPLNGSKLAETKVESLENERSSKKAAGGISGP